MTRSAVAREDRGHPVGADKQGIKSVTCPGTAHAGRTHRHAGNRQPARHRLLCQQPCDVSGRHVALDEIVAHDRCMASGKLWCDLQPVFERPKLILIDVLRLDREPRLPDMIQPVGAAYSGGRFEHLQKGCRVSDNWERQGGCCACHQKCASFHWEVL